MRYSTNVALREPTDHRLAFVSITGDNTNFWDVKRTGDYQSDCACGRDYGDALLAYMREHKDPVIFGSVMRAIISGGIYQGVEIGFFTRLGINLTV